MKKSLKPQLKVIVIIRLFLYRMSKFANRQGKCMDDRYKILIITGIIVVLEFIAIMYLLFIAF